MKGPEQRRLSGGERPFPPEVIFLLFASVCFGADQETQVWEGLFLQPGEGLGRERGPAGQLLPAPGHQGPTWTPAFLCDCPCPLPIDCLLLDKQLHLGLFL